MQKRGTAVREHHDNLCVRKATIFSGDQIAGLCMCPGIIERMCLYMTLYLVNNILLIISLKSGIDSSFICCR